MFFTPSLNVGGLERILLTYAQGLAVRGYDVSYVLCHDNGTFTSELSEKIRVINLASLRLRKSVLKLAHVIRIYRPEIIITANDATLVVLLAKWISGVHAKIITSQHSYITDVESNTMRSKLVIRYCFRYCYKVIAVSRGIERMLTDSLGLSHSKVVLIYNPIEVCRVLRLSEEKSMESGDYVVFVGRLSPVKNLSFLIRVFRQFVNKYPERKLVIVGDGIERDCLERSVQQIGLQNKVIFMGVQANPYPYLRGARVVVLPSLSEAFPTVLIESMVLGKTILTTPTLGAFEILHEGKLGYVSESFNDESEFFRLLEQAWIHPVEPLTLEKKGLEYDLDKKISELETLWSN